MPRSDLAIRASAWMPIAMCVLGFAGCAPLPSYMLESITPQLVNDTSADLEVSIRFQSSYSVQVHTVLPPGGVFAHERIVIRAGEPRPEAQVSSSAESRIELTVVFAQDADAYDVRRQGRALVAVPRALGGDP